jgi:hypothetical protein
MENTGTSGYLVSAAAEGAVDGRKTRAQTDTHGAFFLLGFFLCDGAAIVLLISALIRILFVFVSYTSWQRRPSISLTMLDSELGPCLLASITQSIKR